MFSKSHPSISELITACMAPLQIIKSLHRLYYVRTTHCASRTNMSVSWLKDQRHGKVTQQKGAGAQGLTAPSRVLPFFNTFSFRNLPHHKWSEIQSRKDGGGSGDPCNTVSSHAVFCGISGPFWNTARDWKLLLPLLTGSVCLNGVSYGPTKPAFM